MRGGGGCATMTSRCAPHDAAIRQLAASGHSARQIATDIGCGLTKGMIMGWCDRRKIKLLHRPGTNRGRGGKFATVPPRIPEPPKPPRGGLGPSYMHQRPMVAGPAPRTCRYPLGDPMERHFHYCGEPIWRGSYCEGHYRACHIGVRD